MPGSVQDLDQLELNLSSGNLLLLNIILGFVMFGVAIGIDLDDFKQVAKQPKAVIIGLTGQWIILPAFTFLLIAIAGDALSVGMAMGMLLVASCPGGNISNFMVHLARGNTALSVSLTAISTIGSIILTPLTFLFWGGMYSMYIANGGENPLLRELSIDPWQVAQTVSLLLGLPLLVGMSLKRYFPKIVKAINTPMRWFSIVAFLAIVVVAFSKNSGAFMQYIDLIFITVFLHNLGILLSGYAWARGWGLNLKNRRTVAIEMGIQNSGLGLVLLLNPAIFPQELPIGGMAAITAWWGIWHIISGLSIAGLWRSNAKQKELVHGQA